MTDSWDGRPPNPEQSGMYLLRSRLTGHLTGWYWNAATERFHHEHVTLGRAASIERYVYECPILTPAEVAAQVEAARQEEREACARVADTHAKPHPHARVFTHEEALRAEGYEDAGHDIAAAIRARGDA